MSKYTKKITIHGSKKGVTLGGGTDVVVQTMLNKKPDDLSGNIEQAKRCVDAGAEIVRFSVPNEEALLTLENLVREIDVPIVADIHFKSELAIASAKRGAAKLRINPGNIGGLEKTAKVIDVCKEYNCAVRVGVNAGSLEKDIAEREDLSFAEKLVESANNYCTFIKDECGFDDIVVSIKAHDVPTCVSANRLFSTLNPSVPLHIGVTEAGTCFQGLIKSSAALGVLLEEGIGDTIRISLTDEPEVEVRAAWGLLSAMGLRRRGVEIISCPTCARTSADIISIAKEVESALSNIKKPIQVAVMGCEVNGPGEATTSDVGIACTKGGATLFVRGNIIRRVDRSEILSAILSEIEKL